MRLCGSDDTRVWFMAAAENTARNIIVSSCIRFPTMRYIWRSCTLRSELLIFAIEMGKSYAFDNNIYFDYDLWIVPSEKKNNVRKEKTNGGRQFRRIYIIILCENIYVRKRFEQNVCLPEILYERFSTWLEHMILIVIMIVIFTDPR